MALNVGIVNDSLITQGVRESKIDLATPVNMYTTLRADSRAQKLSELTLNEDERKQKKIADIRSIYESNKTDKDHVDTERVLPILYGRGYTEEADALQRRLLDAAKAKQEAMAVAGNAASAVLSSKDPTATFLQFQKYAKENNLPISEDVKNHSLTDEEGHMGKLHPKIESYLQYLDELRLTPEQKLARQKAEAEGTEKPLSAKDQLDEVRRNKEDSLNESFRSFIPSIDVAGLSKSPDARNKMIKTVLSRPDGNSSLAKELIKSLKDGGEDFAGKLANTVALMNIKSQNREVPANDAVEIGGTNAAVSSIDKLMEVIPNIAGESKWNPITDPINSMNPWNTRIQAKKQYIASVKQIIGKGLEGGVLRAEDERKYEKIIPKMGDTPEVFKAKATQLRADILNKRKYMLEGLKSAGFNVSGFKDLAQEAKTVGKWKKVNE